MPSSEKLFPRKTLCAPPYTKLDECTLTGVGLSGTMARLHVPICHKTKKKAKKAFENIYKREQGEEGKKRFPFWPLYTKKKGNEKETSYQIVLTN